MIKFQTVLFGAVLLMASVVFGGVEQSAQMLQQPADVEKVMNLILNQHVDKHRLNEQIIKKSFKVYVNQFDPQRIYLLESEAAPYMNMRDEDAARILLQYRNHDFSAYRDLQRLIQRSVRRARDYRQSLDTNSLFSSERFQENVYPQSNGFATDLSELRARQRQHAVRFVENESRRFGQIPGEQNRDRLLALHERQVEANENEYLYLSNEGKNLTQLEQDNLFYMHVLKALAHSLDEHTSVFNENEAYDMRIRLEKGFEGIGIVIKRGVNGYVIKRMLADSPAARNEQIKVNDALLAVDGQQVSDMPVEEVMLLLRGKQGSPVVLDVKHKEGGAVEKVQLMREKIIVHDGRVETDYEFFEDGIIGMIKLHAFYQGNGISSERDVRKAIEELNKQGNLRGLILDLRDNSGGFLTQAVKVAGLFITNGVVVVSKYSNGEEHYYRDMDGKVTYNGPLIVLTSRQTASAAEIVAQALQDYGVAIVVGDEQTYGKGTIQSQTVTNKGGGSYFKVTVGKYYTVSGKTPQKQGVKADVLVPGFGSEYRTANEYADYSSYEDAISPAYDDGLADIDPGLRPWYMRYYVPTLQQRSERWHSALPKLRGSSEMRISKNSHYQQFLRGEPDPKGADLLEFEDAGDPQLHEAVNIVKDMIILDSRESGDMMIGTKISDTKREVSQHSTFE